MNPPVNSATVRVMKSFDYSHFEITLSTSLPVYGVQDGKVTRLGDTPLSIESIDELRKQAARLADKAVEQYKIAKTNAQRILDQSYGFQRLKHLADEAKKITEVDRTPEQKANIKALADFVHHQKYDYQDDWEEQD